MKLEQERDVDWQPIETAPKVDRGVPLLAIRAGGFSASQPFYWALIFWSGTYQDWADYFDGEPAELTPVTHWMPLPSPPGPTNDR